jgi:hypothetical protein
MFHLIFLALGHNPRFFKKDSTFRVISVFNGLDKNQCPKSYALQVFLFITSLCKKNSGIETVSG